MRESGGDEREGGGTTHGASGGRLQMPRQGPAGVTASWRAPSTLPRRDAAALSCECVQVCLQRFRRSSFNRFSVSSTAASARLIDFGVVLAVLGGRLAGAGSGPLPCVSASGRGAGGAGPRCRRPQAERHGAPGQQARHAAGAGGGCPHRAAAPATRGGLHLSCLSAERRRGLWGGRGPSASCRPTAQRRGDDWARPGDDCVVTGQSLQSEGSTVWIDGSSAAAARSAEGVNAMGVPPGPPAEATAPGLLGRPG